MARLARHAAYALVRHCPASLRKPDFAIYAGAPDMHAETPVVYEDDDAGQATFIYVPCMLEPV